MDEQDEHGLIAALAAAASPLGQGPRELDPLLAMIGDARVVAIGEATHGSHEFYRIRAQLTQRLIAEKGFLAVAAEADWPEAYRVNRHVRGIGSDSDARAALADFRRFPSWLWRNTEVLEFVGWLRAFNDRRPTERKAGFYGLDLYSLHASIDAVLRYLDRADPEAARRARARYACFDHAEEDPQLYGYAVSLGIGPNCEQEAVRQLLELQGERTRMLQRDGLAAEDEYFHIEQNARLVKNAEQYYRSMFQARTSSWNLRDMHMADTLDALLDHLSDRRVVPKIVVWAHNSHVGDARATELSRAGELTLGQLTRERHPGEVALIGFSTYAGTVTAASEWDGPTERKDVRPARPDSYEALLHRAFGHDSILPLRALGEVAGRLREERLERAIGVIYRPETERSSHYFHASLPAQFDAIVHIDRTRALEPLERSSIVQPDEAPETFPSAL